MHNEHAVAIPASVLADIVGLFQQILAKLEPYRVPLTTEERREMAIIGDKTLAFLEKGKEFVDLYPDLVPTWLNKADFAVDFDDVHNITPVKNLAEQVQEAIYNIQYVAGNEAYRWMLDYYHAAKHAASRDVPNAKVVDEELRKRFHHGRRPHKENEEE
jgi:hypothetical protein